MNADLLAQRIQAEIASLRAAQRIPTQVRLNQQSWNALRGKLSYGSFGPRDTVLIEGLPCVLSFDLDKPFRVRSVEVHRG